MEKIKELRVKVREFLTKPNPNYPDREPVPMRTMFGYATKETQNGIYMVLRGKPEPSTTCLHCGRTLTHPVSLLYGIGPTCGEHFHINPFKTEEELNKHYEKLKSKLADVIWEGWLPKHHIEWEETGELVEPFHKEAEEEKEEKVEENDDEERLYPRLSSEQEKLVELAKLDSKEENKPKPVEIWIDKKGIIKLVFDNNKCLKIDREGNDPIDTGYPYPPKYEKAYVIEYNEIEKLELEIDEELVNALADELNGVFN